MTTYVESDAWTDEDGTVHYGESARGRSHAPPWNHLDGHEPPPADDPPPVNDQAGDPVERAYQRDVSREVRQLRIRDDARRVLRAEQAGHIARPTPVLLTDLLAEPDQPTRYRIDGLLPVGGRVVLAAQYKAGKTTLTGNLVRCLADGAPFLGKYEVTAPTGRVVVLDNEMSRNTIRCWLRDQGIRDQGRVIVEPLRGHVGSFDVLDPAERRWWVDTLRAYEPGVLIVDCLRPVLDALGLDENTDTGRVLIALDEITERTGAEELIVVHHMGHTGERSRGSSRLRDWPDVEWRLVREDPDNPASRRFFSAYGRDVEVSEAALDYDPTTRHLTLAGGSRRDAAAVALVPDLLRLLADQPGLSGRGIEERLTDGGIPQKTGREAVKRGIHAGYIRTAPGPKGAYLHYATGSGERFARTSRSATGLVSAGDALAEQDHNDLIKLSAAESVETPGHSASASARRSASELPQHGESECVSASNRDAHTLTAEQTRSSSASTDAQTCSRCQQPTQRLIRGWCSLCACPTGDAPSEERAP